MLGKHSLREHRDYVSLCELVVEPSHKDIGRVYAQWSECSWMCPIVEHTFVLVMP